MYVPVRWCHGEASRVYIKGPSLLVNKTMGWNFCIILGELCRVLICTHGMWVTMRKVWSLCQQQANPWQQAHNQLWLEWVEWLYQQKSRMLLIMARQTPLDWLLIQQCVAGTCRDLLAAWERMKAFFFLRGKHIPPVVWGQTGHADWN